MKPRRNKDPRNPLNWRLVCSLCAAEFVDTENINLTSGHAQTEHPGEPVQFTLVWVGLGPRPRARR